MTKRFISNYDGSEIIDQKESLAYAFHSGAEEPIIELLNELAEENKQLQIELNTYKAGNRTLKKTLDEIRNHLNENEEIT